MNPVEVFSTLLAKVFIRRALCAEDADARAVLPDLTDITLNEEASNIFSEFNGSKEVCVWAVERGAAGIVLRLT